MWGRSFAKAREAAQIYKIILQNKNGAGLQASHHQYFVDIFTYLRAALLPAVRAAGAEELRGAELEVERAAELEVLALGDAVVVLVEPLLVVVVAPEGDIVRVVVSALPDSLTRLFTVVCVVDLAAAGAAVVLPAEEVVALVAAPVDLAAEVPAAVPVALAALVPVVVPVVLAALVPEVLALVLPAVEVDLVAVVPAVLVAGLVEPLVAVEPAVLVAVLPAGRTVLFDLVTVAASCCSRMSRAFTTERPVFCAGAIPALRTVNARSGC